MLVPMCKLHVVAASRDNDNHRGGEPERVATNRSPWPLCQVSALIVQQKMVAEQRPSSEVALREGVNCGDSMTLAKLISSSGVQGYKGER